MKINVLTDNHTSSLFYKTEVFALNRSLGSSDRTEEHCERLRIEWYLLTLLFVNYLLLYVCDVYIFLLVNFGEVNKSNCTALAIYNLYTTLTGIFYGDYERVAKQIRDSILWRITPFRSYRRLCYLF